MTELEVCTALTRIGSVFDCRRFLCVPNVSHGWGLSYEADLIAVTRSGYAYEVEIKTSLQDLAKDRHKAKWRNGLDKRIKRFYYAVPDALVRAALDTDDRYGVVRLVEKAKSPWDSPGYRTEVARKAKDLDGHRQLVDNDWRVLHHLIALRYWDLRLYGKDTVRQVEETAVCADGDAV